MQQIDVFKNQEYLNCGHVYSFGENEIISSSSPEWYGKNIVCNKSGGAQIRLLTNAETVQITYRVTDIKRGSFQHTGITGQIGVAISYRLLHESNWYNIELSYPRNDTETIILRMNRYRGWSEGYELAIALPAFAYISMFLIEVGEDNWIRPADKKENILLIGGPAAMGSGTSGRHLAIGSILSRHANYTVEENTFFHWKWLEEALHISFDRFEIFLLEMPVENISSKYLQDHGKRLLDKICTQMNRKIILWHQLQFENSAQKQNLAIINEFAKEYRTQVLYDENFYLCKSEQEDQFMIDHSYMGDWGHIYIADLLMKQLEGSDGVSC